MNAKSAKQTPDNLGEMFAHAGEGYNGIAHDFETLRVQVKQLGEINAELLAALEAIAKQPMANDWSRAIAQTALDEAKGE